jgi:hypothetical protein
VAWWDPRVGNGNRETAGSNYVFRDRDIFTPSPITSYRGSNLLHLLKLL